MKLVLLTCLASFALHGLAQTFDDVDDIDNDDVPSACLSICSPAIGLSQLCDDLFDDDDDDDNDDDDRLEANCVCTAEKASVVIPLCAACVAQNRPQSANDNDVLDVVNDCRFSTTTYDANSVYDSAITLATAGVTTTFTGIAANAATATANAGTGNANAAGNGNVATTVTVAGTSGQAAVATSAVSTVTQNGFVSTVTARVVATGTAVAAVGAGTKATAGFGAGIAAAVGLVAML